MYVKKEWQIEQKLMQSIIILYYAYIIFGNNILNKIISGKSKKKISVLKSCWLITVLLLIKVLNEYSITIGCLFLINYNFLKI
jgi:hypothetical protein